LAAAQTDDGARRYLDARLATLKQIKHLAEQEASTRDELLDAFIKVESSEAMLKLVQEHAELLSAEWIATIEALVAAQADDGARRYLDERLATLKELKRLADQQASLADAVRLLVEFAGSDWTVRRRMLTDKPELLRADVVEPALDYMIAQAGDNADVVGAIEDVRVLLQRCRRWDIDSVQYLALGMRLGDSLPIPPEHEDAVMHIAGLLAHSADEPPACELAVAAMQRLLDGLPAGTPDLFGAALRRDLADALQQLPAGHAARDVARIEAYYREAIPAYHAANRPVSVAYTQRSLGDLLSAQGRYEEALEPLQAAAQGLEQEERPAEAAWALSAYADALENLDRADEALNAYAEAIRLLPDAAPLLRNRAAMLIRSRRLEDAEADLARAVEVEGHENSPYLWARRAQLAIARGDVALADRLLDEVGRRDPPPELKIDDWRAQAAWLRQDMPAAQAALQRALAEANAGERSAARREWERLFAEHPDLPGADDLRALFVVDAAT
jgi:tetratricopeptide (TPR) repeat protein